MTVLDPATKDLTLQHSNVPHSFPRRSFLFLLLALVGYWLLLIRGLGAQWSIYEQYNYGWAVPFLCGYLVWRKLGDRRWEPGEGEASKIRNPKSEIRNTGPLLPAPSSPLQAPFSLFLALALCALAYAFTRWFHEANPVWRLTGWLWAIEVVAITLLTLKLAEQQGAGRLEKSEVRSQKSEVRSQKSEVRNSELRTVVSLSRRLVVPIAFFLVAVPWPWPVEQRLVQAFTHLNSTAIVELLGFFDIPAAQHGNVIEISAGNIGIDEACSGIRSFQATLMLSLFFGEMYSLTVARRVLCVLAGFAFSMIFNLGRTLLLVYVGSSQGIKAIAAWHDPAGTTILVGCFLGLWGLALWLRGNKQASELRGRRSNSIVAFVGEKSPAFSPSHEPPTGGFEEASSPQPSPPEKEREKTALRRGSRVQSAKLFSGNSLPVEAHGESKGDEAPAIGDQLLELRSQQTGPLCASPLSAPALPRFNATLCTFVALLVWLILVEAGTELWYRSHEGKEIAGQNWSVQIPNGAYKSNQVPAGVISEFQYDQGNNLKWQDSSGASWQLFYFRWLPSTTLARRVKVQRAKMHGPETCLPHAGVALHSDLGVFGIPVGNLILPLHQYTFQSEGKLFYVFFGIYEDATGNSVLANRRIGIASRVHAAMAGSRNYGQRFLELAVAGYDRPDSARAALQAELEKLIKIEH